MLISTYERGLIYISSGDSILRYSVSDRALMAPVQLGGDLGGMDISPNGDTLAVANRSASADEATNSIFLVNLEDGTSRAVPFARAAGEGGTWAVAYANDGRLLVSSRFNGSGSVPLRRYDPATGETTVLNASQPMTVRQDTMLSASGNRKVIGFAEPRQNYGPWGTYTSSSGTFSKLNTFETGTHAFNYEVGINRDGSQIAVQTFEGTYFYYYDSNNYGYGRGTVLGDSGDGRPIGLAFHPSLSRVYLPWSSTSEVRIYDAGSFAEIGRYDFETTFSPDGTGSFLNGRSKISRDGSLLTVSVPGGVRFIALNSLQANYQSVPAYQETSTPITLSASNVAAGAAVSFGVVTPPTLGALSGSGANLIYTPRSGSKGIDSFIFQASANGEVSKGKITLEIIDRSAPIVTISTPGNGVMMNSVAVIQGTVADNLNGSGTASVYFTLQRQGDGKYWNGTRWANLNSSYAVLPAALSGPNNETWSSGRFKLPSPRTTDVDTQLTDGSYTVTATARDYNGNVRTVTSRFTVDATPPLLAVTSPLDKSSITVLTMVQGTVSDGAGGSGVARVDLKLKRGSDGLYWTGSEWGTVTPVTLSTSLKNGVWSRAAAGLPSTSATDLARQLTAGTYILTATAFDKLGNGRDLSTSFILDKINPAVTISTPVNQSFVTALLTVAGTATDNAGGSGIARLDVLLKRNADGIYWTGTSWGTTTPVTLPAGLNKGAWGLTSDKLPSPTATEPGQRLTDGTYLVTATTYDKAGNQKSIGSFFTVDRVNPAVTITTPINRSFVSSLSSVSGTATDANGGGIARVDVFLKRNRDGVYWNGTAWGTTTPFALPVGPNKGNWGLSSAGLPSTSAADPARRLAPGDYTLFATAYDRASNQKSTSNFFTVMAPTADASAPAS